MNADTRLRTVVGSVVGFGLLVAILFWPAGRPDWPAGWSFIALLLVSSVAQFVYVRRVNPDVIEHRMRFGPGTKRWDIVWSVVFAPLFAAIFVVAGLDAVRFGWTSMSGGFWPAGLLLFVVGSWLFAWPMAVNPFFEKNVRIQTERGHRVIDTGPYAWVRHPGYVGFTGWCLSVPLLLGSWWAFVPAVLTVVSLVVRTALEDATLRAELGGYEEYAGRVRYRLVPGVW